MRGICDNWPLLDGGYITIPEDSDYGLDSQWMVVEDSPGELLAGHDTQLETDVNYLLDQLNKKPGGLPPPPALLPAYPSAAPE